MASATVEAEIDRRAAQELVACTLTELLLYFLRLGTAGFGGPIALVGYMQRDLVEKRRWISRQDYVEGLALAQLAPGPLAAQLAIYLGWVRGGATGATVVGAAFVLPSFVMVLAISALSTAASGSAPTRSSSATWRTMRSRRTTPGARSTSGSSSTASTGTKWRSGTRLSIGCEASRAADGRTGQQDLRHGAGHRQRALPPPLSTIGCPEITWP